MMTQNALPSGSYNLTGREGANEIAPDSKSATSEADPSRIFRDGMRRVANSVAIITACTGGERRGMTATAICSLSADPPMLAVSINKSSSAYQAISESGSFAVNFLNGDHVALADAFAGGVSQALRFREGNWRDGEFGAPVLEGSVTTFECERADMVDVATHTLFIGLVRSVRNAADAAPLLYHDRRYRRCD